MADYNFDSTIPGNTTNVKQDNINSRQNELILQNNFKGTSAPSNPVEGQDWYDTTNKQMKRYDGSVWQDIDLNSTVYKDVLGSYGSLNSLEQRLAVSIADDGTLKTGAMENISEFKSTGYAFTFISANSFTVPSDVTNVFVQGLAIEAMSATSTPSYSYSHVKSSSYTNSVTTVTLYDSILDATLEDIRYGILCNGLPYQTNNSNLKIEESTGYGIISGLSTTVAGMTATVAAGIIHMENGNRYTTVQSTLTIPTADATNTRIDLIYVSSTGVVTYLAGTPSVNPVVPTLPTGGFSLSNISIAANATAVVITDTRYFKTQYNYNNQGIINALYPPAPLVPCKANANYFSNGSWYEDSNYLIPATDDSDSINAMTKLNKDIYFPPGNYYHTKSINLTARQGTLYSAYGSKRFFGGGQNSTVFRSYTGIYPAIDLTGSGYLHLSGFSISADFGAVTGHTLSKVGILDARGTASDTSKFCEFNTFERIKINMGSDITANGGIGTIGFINFGGEHLYGRQLEIYANLPQVQENVLDIPITSYSAIDSSYEIPATTSGSTTVCHFDTCALVSYDSFRSLHLSQVGNMKYTNLYTSTRYLTGSVNSTAESIYMNNCNGCQIHCYQETSGIYGSVYKNDHNFIKLLGSQLDNDVEIERTFFPVGYVQPSNAVAILDVVTGTIFSNSKFNCHFSIGTYSASGDTIAMTAIAISGVALSISQTSFTMDEAYHGLSFTASLIAGGSSINQCTNINWYTGKSQLRGGDTIQKMEAWITCTSGKTVATQDFTFSKTFYSQPIVLATITGDSVVGNFDTGVQVKVSNITGAGFTLKLTSTSAFALTGDWGINIIAIGEIA